MRSFYPSLEVIFYLSVLITLFKPFAYCRTTFDKQQQQESRREINVFGPRSIMKRGSIPPGLMHTFLKLDGTAQTGMGGKRRGVLPRTKLEAYLLASLKGRHHISQLLPAASLPAAVDEKRREISTKSSMVKLLPFFSNDNNNESSSSANAKRAEFPYARPGKRERMDVADLNRTLIRILLRLLGPERTEARNDQEDKRAGSH